MNDLKTILNEDGITYIPITRADFPLPRKLLQGGHEEGIIITEGDRRAWQWHGFKEIGGIRYIRCDQIELRPLDSIFSLEESQAMRVLSSFAHAVEQSTLTTYFMFGEIFITADGGFLFLPPMIREIMEASRTEEELYESKGCWTNPKFFHQQALSFQLTAMAYAILNDGESPVANPRVRQDSYQAVPVEMFRPGIDERLKGFFSFRLSKRQEIDETVPEWIASFDELDTSGIAAYQDSPSEELTAFIGKQEKRANRNESLRIHKVRNMVFATIAVIFIGIAYTVISNIMEPPLTAGMDAEQVVEFYYACHNDLDSVSMDDALAKGVDNPAEQTLTYLHVTTSVRQAYEFESGFFTAQEWIDAGKPDLDNGEVVYGVTDLELTWTSSDTVRAEYLLWNPVFPDEETMQRDTPAQATHIIEDLVMGLNGKYWEITGIRRISAEVID